MSKKCTLLWCEANSKSKCTKHTRFGALLEVVMSKKCTPLWREANSKSKCTKQSRLGALLEVVMSKKCTLLRREANFKSKCTKHTRFGALLEVVMSKKCTLLRREANFQIKMYKAHHSRTIFGSWVHAIGARSRFPNQNFKNATCPDHSWRFRCGFCVAGAQNSAPCQEWAKRVGFLAWPKTMACVGHFKKICKDACRGAGAVQETCSSEMFIRDVRRLGRWFPEKVAFWIILEHQIFRFAKMILRDRCSTSYDLASLSRGRRSTLHRWRGKSQNALVRGRQLCTQLSMFEGSVNRFVFDVVQVQNWGSLAKLLRFGCCQVQVVQGPKFEHFWLANVLCATTACILSTAELQQVLRTWCVLYILTSKCASRHNGVQFFISRLAKWLRTRRFRELTFQNIGKIKWLATFLPFRTPASTFFWLFLFFLLPFSSLTLLWLFSPLLFHLSILLEVWLLNSSEEQNRTGSKPVKICESKCGT